MRSSYVIHWPAGLDNTFNYGSEIKFENGQVNFKQPRMSPGKKIHTWYSRRSSTWLINEPELPILEIGAKYQLLAHFKQTPDDSVHIQLNFFDVKGDEIEQLVLNELDSVFEVPIGTRTYEISLANLNNQQLIFSDLIIQPVASEMIVKAYRRDIQVVLVWQKKQRSYTKVQTRFRDRFLNTGTYAGNPAAFNVYIEFDGKIPWTEDQMRKALLDATDWMRKVIEDNDLKFDVLATENKFLSHPSRSIRLMEKAADFTLSQVLHQHLI